MRIIIDTHIFLWAISDPQRLSPKQRPLIESSANIVYVSAISIAEIMIKKSLGKLTMKGSPLDVARKSGFELLDFNADAAILLGSLPFHHKDPFDRMLIAQSLTTKFAIMTDDRKFSKYDCKLV
jgi:PIN domain nuclease of toxin-antitoxin system